MVSSLGQARVAASRLALSMESGCTPGPSPTSVGDGRRMVVPCTRPGTVDFLIVIGSSFSRLPDVDLLRLSWSGRPLRVMNSGSVVSGLESYPDVAPASAPVTVAPFWTSGSEVCRVEPWSGSLPHPLDWGVLFVPPAPCSPACDLGLGSATLTCPTPLPIPTLRLSAATGPTSYPLRAVLCLTPRYGGSAASGPCCVLRVSFPVLSPRYGDPPRQGPFPTLSLRYGGSAASGPTCVLRCVLLPHPYPCATVGPPRQGLHVSYAVSCSPTPGPALR
jgi:hypothetical protein